MKSTGGGQEEKEGKRLTERFLNAAMHLCISGRSGWASYEETNQTWFVRQSHTTAADECLDTHLHVSLQLL